MAIYEVFCHSLVVRYKTTICSKTTCFHIFTKAFAFILPLLITYYTQGFWKRIDSYQEQPDVSFKHKMLLILETTRAEKIIFWSTYSKLNNMVSNNLQLLVPSIEHIEKDINRDGIKDELHMKIEVPVVDQEIISLKLILIFDYKLYLYSNFQMECAAYVHHTAAMPGASFSAVGELLLQQKGALKSTGTDQRYNIPIIDEKDVKINSYFLENIFVQYAQRNVSTTFQNMYPIWKTGKVMTEPFKINLVVLYPVQTIIYKVGLWQLLKWALVQYMAVFAVVSYIMYHIRLCFFQKQIVPSIVISPIKKNI